jgi:hypothetical protein
MSRRLAGSISRRKLALDEPDAVLAGQRAAEPQHEVERFVEAALGPRELGGVVRVDEQVDVDVAVAGVAEVHDRDAVARRELAQAVDQGRDPRHRDDHVLVDLLRGDVAQGGGERAPGAPEVRGGSGVGGAGDADQPVHRRRRGHRVDRLPEAVARAVDLDHQQRRDRLGEAQVLVAADHVDRAAVHELERAGRYGLRHDRRDCRRRRPDGPVGGLQRVAGLRQRRKPEGCLGDDREGALRADQQPGEVVADHALGGRHPGADRLAGTGHGAQAEGVVAGGAVLDRARPGGVAGEVAAHRADRRARRVGWPEEAVGRDGVLQGLVGEARLDAGEAVARLEREHAVHALER